MTKQSNSYPASLDIDFQVKHDRLTTFFRILWVVPILIILSLLTATGAESFSHEAGKEMSSGGGGIVGGLFLATAFMIVFRQRYPRWWFDFNLELHRFSTRVGAYIFLLTDQYPSTIEEQTVHLNIKYPDVEKDLNKWLPLVKWLLAFPHYIVLVVLMIGAMFAAIVAWFTILFTGSYSKGLHDYITGVFRWNLRVEAYAILLTTDQYPPFSIK